MPTKPPASATKGQKSLFSFFKTTPVSDTKSSFKEPALSTTPNSDHINLLAAVESSDCKEIGTLTSPPPQEVSSSLVKPETKKSGLARLKRVKKSLIDSDDEEWDDANNSSTPNIKSNKESSENNPDASFIDSDDDVSDEESTNSSKDFLVDSDDDSITNKSKKRKLKAPQVKTSSIKKLNTAKNSTTTPKSVLKSSSASSSSSELAKFSPTGIISPTHTDIEHSQYSNSDILLSPTPTSSAKPAIILPEGVVGLGSHEHNQWEWYKIKNRKDKNGYKVDHSEYNHRTLYVPDSFMREQTPAMAQWWKFKQDNYDTVLFFKVGKFYELFHMDADIGMSELDLIYMKGTKAHSGFPEISYGKFASILVSKGYRVARVEQTETPDMLKERNSNNDRGKKEKVVTRELCSVMSKGTRTYCHLDDLSLLTDSTSAEMNTTTTTTTTNQVMGTSSILLCIKEIQTQHIDISSSSIYDTHSLSHSHSYSHSHSHSQTQLIEKYPEYGLCCVDTMLGTIIFAQFQDDLLRSRLRTFMSRFQPTEILVEKNHVSAETLGVIKLMAPQALIEYLRSDTTSGSVDKTHTNTTKKIQADNTSNVVEMPRHGSDVIKILKQKHYFNNKLLSNSTTTTTTTSSTTNTTTTSDDKDEMNSWPEILQAMIYGLNDHSSEAVICAFGGILWLLQRSLIDYDILSMKRFYGYVPPEEEFHETTITAAATNTTVTAVAAQTSNCNDVNMMQVDSSENRDPNTSTITTISSSSKDEKSDKVIPKNIPDLYKSTTCLFFPTTQHYDRIQDMTIDLEDISADRNSTPTTTTPSTNPSTTIATTTTTATNDNTAPPGPTSMILDAVALTNLEILKNNYDHTERGSLWAFVNRCKTPFGTRILKDWLCHPLYNITHINNRKIAIQELMTTYIKQAESASNLLKKLPDLERLLLRIHSNSLKKKHTNTTTTTTTTTSSGSNMMFSHPDTRAVMFEESTYSTRKIKDFIDILNGFETVLHIQSLFSNMTTTTTSTTTTTQSLLLHKIIYDKCNIISPGRCAYSEMKRLLHYYRDIFDEKQAKVNGFIKPKPGVDNEYDEAKADIQSIETSLDEYIKEMKRKTGINDLKYWGSNKDRYQIEVDITKASKVPSDWIAKSQKKTHRRYWTNYIEKQMNALLNAEDRIEQAQRDTLRKIFEKFDENRQLWNDAVLCMGTLDALLSMATVSSSPNYVWPVLLSPQEYDYPVLDIDEGRHPMLEYVFEQRGDGTYIPNTVTLGGLLDANLSQSNTIDYLPRLLLLSGPNMGGKSTLLRQTCLIAIMAQVGYKVPASRVRMTPVDRIFTRVGATDRILSGQSTFFVELAETATILKSATKRSICILDELGRGTATFDGTAIAHAVIHHLVSTSLCCTLFATHYHTLIDDWNMDPRVKLGHMDCIVHIKNINNINNNSSSNNSSYGESVNISSDNIMDISTPGDIQEVHAADDNNEEVTFLFKLCDGSSPKSYGINVARLAGLPLEVIKSAMDQSKQFEIKMKSHMITQSNISGDRMSSTNKNMDVQMSPHKYNQMISYLEKLISIIDSKMSYNEIIYHATELWRRYQTI